MSHWLPVSTSANERSYNPCPGCSYNVPALSKKFAIKQRCNSEKCFFNVSLSETVGYPTKHAKVFAAYLPITLSTSWSYATSLALTYLESLSFTPSSNDNFSSTSTNDANDNTFVPSLPPSVQNLYTDHSFRHASESTPPSMSPAWLALDDDGFILDSFSISLPSCSPSALRSEIYAVVLGLYALPFGSSITINTDCSQLISLWTSFVNVPFSPKLFRQINHLLWLSIRHIVKNLDLKVKLNKIPAHKNNAHNIQVDSLAKNAHSFMQPTFSPMAIYQAPCLLKFNSLPIDMNIRHFLRSIADARALLSFCSMTRFTALGSSALFDWAVIYKIISPLLNDFQVKLYGEIWLCQNVLFHAWEESQGITATSKLRGPSTTTASTISPYHHNSSLATVSQDSWISWISSSIIRGGS
ncbi:ribonuclease H-like domain-containing protein [Rhizophagus irregularis DAOM 181602=DAOM 197198]|nr:ribonuclease H-like domain-containing protein [Rhizophagus irregularis DAOM 181602=DAOM 197198]